MKSRIEKLESIKESVKDERLKESISKKLDLLKNNKTVSK
jgi:hypothetical protein